MYTTAVNHFKYLASDDDLTQYSSGVWHKMWKEFNVRVLANPRREDGRGFTGKPVVMPITDWKFKGGIWRPMVTTPKGKMVLLERLDKNLEMSPKVNLIVEPK